jgi:hypothetical protein
MWVKLDDGFADHPKVRAMSDKALRAHLNALCYAARYLTDGHVPSETLRVIAGPRITAELISVGAWDRNGDGGIVIHDYLELNPSRADVLERRRQKSEAGKASAKARWNK